MPRALYDCPTWTFAILKRNSFSYIYHIAVKTVVEKIIHI